MGAAQLLSSCSWLWLPKWGRGATKQGSTHLIMSHFLLPQDGTEVLVLIFLRRWVTRGW